MDRIEDLPNYDFYIPFWSIFPSVHVIRNDAVGGYDVSGAVGSYVVQEGVQHLLIVSISSLYGVAAFGWGWSTVWIWFNPPSDLAGNSNNTFLRLAAFATLLIGQILIYSMVQVTWRVIQNPFIQHHQTEASIIYCLYSPWLSLRLREEKT